MHVGIWTAVGAYVVYSTAVDAMDEPKPSDTKFYRWLYRFGHAIAGNLFTAFGKIGRTPWPGEHPMQSGDQSQEFEVPQGEAVSVDDRDPRLRGRKTWLQVEQELEEEKKKDAANPPAGTPSK